MSKLFAIMTNDDSLLPVALEEEASALEAHLDFSGGLGLGWLHQDRSLLKKYPSTSAQELSIPRALGSLTTRTIVAAADQGGDHFTQSMSPYRFRQWLYAQHGQLLTEETLDACIAQLPEFLRVNVRQHTDAEALFFSLLHSLHAHDVYHQPTHQAHRRAEATSKMFQALTAAHQATPKDLAMICLTRGYMIACHFGADLYYRTWQGIDEAAPEPLYDGQRTRAQHHKHFKATMVLSASRSPGELWRRVPDGQVLWMGKDWQPHLFEAM